MDIVSYDLSFSFDQHDGVFNALPALLQQKLNQPLRRLSREKIVRDARTILIIDPAEERARYLARFLSNTDYRPVIISTPLEAFTQFLQGELAPLAIILCQEDDAKHLFLHRLVHQIEQKYQWETLLIRLHAPEASAFQPQEPNLPASVSGNLHHGPISDKLRHGPASQPLQPLNERMQYGPQSGPLPRASGPLLETGTRSLASDSMPLIEQSPEKSTKPRISVVGQSLGRYQIGEELGRGAHGTVHKTYDRLRESECALKVVQTDIIPFYVIERSNEEITLFEQEAELLKTLRHPHILPVLNCGKSYVSGSPFIYKTMPHCVQRSLAYWLHQKGHACSVPPRDITVVILQLADALQYIHEQRIVYQNLKISNILILNEGKKVQDMHFALSDFMPALDGHFLSDAVDSLLYAPPERWEGVAVPASDQYSLAAVAYELLTGRPPFQGTTERTLRLLHTSRVPRLPTELNPALPPSVNTVLMRALAKRPEERFFAVSQFALSLMHCWG